MARTDDDGLVIEDTCFSLSRIPGFQRRCVALLGDIDIGIELLDNRTQVGRAEAEVIWSRRSFARSHCEF